MTERTLLYVFSAMRFVSILCCAISMAFHSLPLLGQTSTPKKASIPLNITDSTPYVFDRQKTVAGVQQQVFPLLDHPLMFKVDKKILNDRPEDLVLHFPNEQLLHPQGIFRIENVGCSYSWEHPLLTSFSGMPNYRVIDPNVTRPNEQQVLANAETFMRFAFPWFMDMGPLPEPGIKEPAFPQGRWEINWIRPKSETTSHSAVRLSIRDVDSAVVSFDTLKLTVKWEAKITETEAVQKVLKLAEQDVRTEEIKITEWFRAVGKEQRGYYFLLKGKEKKTGVRLVGNVLIDALDDKVVSTIEWRSPPKLAMTYMRNGFYPQEGAPYTALDSFPVWSKEGLIFVSNRRPARMPEWAMFPPQLMLLKPDTKPLYLTADMVGIQEAKPLSFPTGLASTEWVAMQWHGWTYAFNLETGAHRILGMPERAGETPTIDPEGKWAIVSGTGRDRNTDVDLLPDDLSTRGELLGNRGRLVSKGDDHHPLFSPDKKWLYFVTSSEANGKVTQALRRIPSAFAHTKSVVNLKPTQIETLIANFAGNVLRLSIFPNGQKMLLQTEKEMVLLSVTATKATPLAPKNITDAEVNAPITQTRDGWAGPSDNEVTFSGKTTDKDGKIRWRIYSCRFDGSALKAWTPKENQPVEAYKFPAAPDGKTAIDLAKQWVLKEVEFEDYLKRQGQ